MRMTVDFSSEAIKTMWQRININVLKENQPRILYPAKIFFKKKKKISVFKVGERREVFCFVLSNHFLRKEMVRKKIMKMLIINERDQNKILLLISAGDLPQQVFRVPKNDVWRWWEGEGGAGHSLRVNQVGCQQYLVEKRLHLLNCNTACRIKWETMGMWAGVELWDGGWGF